MSAPVKTNQPLPIRAPIALYGARTGNCIRAAIALEEAELPYVVHKIDLRNGEQRRAPYLSLNPIGQVPTIVELADGASPLVVTQSNAIMLYAAELAPGRLLPKHGEAQRARVVERFFFFVTDVIAPNYAAFLVRRQGVSEVALMLDGRALQAVRRAENHVSKTVFMAGDDFTIADIAAFTITAFYKPHLDWDELPNLRRWFGELEARPSIVRGYQAFS